VGWVQFVLSGGFGSVRFVTFGLGSVRFDKYHHPAHSFALKATSAASQPGVRPYKNPARISRPGGGLLQDVLLLPYYDMQSQGISFSENFFPTEFFSKSVFMN
jgi:hypothetical protein